MMQFFSEKLTHRFWQDFCASIVVFLVALPLCLGIAIASGAPPALGLITGIIGGLIVGTIAGCPLQVSGPAAGLATIVWEAVQQFGLENVGLIVLFAGIIQLTAGWLRMGNWFLAVSPAVIQGMLAGIGTLIFASQFHVMMDDTPQGDGISNLLSIPEALYKGILPMDGSTHHLAAVVGALTIVILIIWNILPRFFKQVPAPLAAVLIAILVSAWLEMPINYVTVPNNLMEALQPPSIIGNPVLLESGFWLAVITFAFIASAETMLTATAIDLMHTGPRTQYNRELLAQGIGNMLCGLAGALPMTGVIVRSSVNVQAGAASRKSTILHGFWILLFVSLFPWLLNKIPIASLAAILVYTGYKLVNPKAIKTLAAQGKSEVAIYAVTLIGIVTTNLLEGVILGFVLSIIRLLYKVCRLEVQIAHDPDNPARTVLMLKGRATFISLPTLVSALDKIPPGEEVIVHTTGLAYLDHACLTHIKNWEQQYKKAGGKVQIHWNKALSPEQEADSARGTSLTSI